ncbi:hypothetical protein XENORESO_020022 [Xenotaenia resolanae]|uniref:Chemokine interleukin-8-like domain-containing protein n=1 Tax=Xenotaenia resolanae TaxID=208358 RepID=A0ABV0X3T3_9TELE
MISIKVTVMPLTLVILCVLSTNTQAASFPCCRRHMFGKLRFQEIKGFSVQNDFEHCSISAIIFHTKNGKKCFNPALEWVMDYVRQIEYMAQKVHQNARN